MNKLFIHYILISKTKMLLRKDHGKSIMIEVVFF